MNDIKLRNGIGNRGMPRSERCSRMPWPLDRTRPFGSDVGTAGNFRAALFCLMLASASWACGGAPDRSEEITRSDSAGVEAVLNGQTDRMLDWTFQPILDIGGDSEGPTAFFRVFPSSIGVDSLGNLYVLDAGNFRVSVFDRAGHQIRSFGRRGEGPGEFGFPSDMAVSPAGEVAVYDFARRALVRFDEKGSYTGLDPLPGPLQRQVALLHDGTIAAAVSQSPSSADSTDYRVLALGRDTVEIAWVRQITRFDPQQFSCMSLASPPYFGDRVIWAAGGNRVTASVDADYSIQVFDHSRLVAEWRRDLPVIRSTLELAAWEVAEGDSLRYRGPAGGPRPDCAVPAEEAARKFGYADVAQILKEMAVSPEGGVWLRRRTEAPGEQPIDVLDASGAYVGTLPTQSPFPALFRSPDEVVSVETDDFGLTHIVVYQISKGS